MVFVDYKSGFPAVVDMDGSGEHILYRWQRIAPSHAVGERDILF